ncbi:MAG: hypothetical protein DRP84_12120 [Spirochaetes bacterium]|nr:MAG: hypothetical protein DRP84_12120 [Spirochaetota bacterium]
MDEIDRLLRKLEPVIGKNAKILWYLNNLAKDSKEARQNTELIKLMANKKAKQDYKEEISLPPPRPDKLIGKYRLGEVLYPESYYGEFGLRENEFIRHILITGMTGTGKTNLSFHLLRQLKKHNRPFLVFDWKKNYRNLKQLPEFKDLKIINLTSEGEMFKFNPLIPPQKVNPKHWMTLLVDVIKHAFFVSHGVEYFFRKGLDYLYEQFGIFEGKNKYPTFRDLEKVLQKEFVRGREMLWMSSAKRVLASLTFSGLLGDIINTREQQPIEELLNKDVIIELDNLATIERIFFIEALLLWIYHYRKTQSKREEFKHAIIIEEAHHIVSSKKEYEFGEETIIETIIRMIREFGESIIIIDQEPGKLSNSILANTLCKISFNLGNGKDVSTISRAMNLTREEKRYIDKLKVGHAIIKMKERFSEPIHIRFPLVPIIKSPVGIP